MKTIETTTEGTGRLTRAVVRGSRRGQDGVVGASLPLAAAGTIVYAVLFGFASISLLGSGRWPLDAGTTMPGVLALTAVLSALDACWAVLLGFDVVRRLTDVPRRSRGEIVLDLAALVVVGMIQIAVTSLRAAAS